MRLFVCLLTCLLLLITSSHSQSLAVTAKNFINTLDTSQRSMALYPFDSDERYNFHYTPVDRKGLSIEKMNAAQKKAAFQLLKTVLTDATVKKVNEIIELEVILKELENRKPDDHFRDPGKYYLTIFGTPDENSVWGWRFEGHHISFNFSAKDNTIVAGTPGFLGSNPAIVQQGPQKGKEILKDEKDKGLAFLLSLNKEQLQSALIDSIAPGEIITGNQRKAMIHNADGLAYSKLTAAQRGQLLQLVSLYVHRYKKPFAENMLKDIQQAGFDKLKFVWAGHMQTGPGHPHYYRITGPTIIIEYDNTQNNANHVHTVVRDLVHDYGGDELLEHYKKGHH